MKKYNLTIVIVTFNSEKYIGKCIDSIIKSERQKTIYTINIIDNCSKDKTVKIVNEKQKKNSNIFLIKNKINIGFARAVNQGISWKNNNKNIDGYVLLLNPDTLLEKKSITKLIDCAEKNESGICGGSTVDGRGIASGSYFRTPNIMVGIFDFTNLRKLYKNDKWHKYFYYQDTSFKEKTSFPVEVVTGGYMLISWRTIKKIGLLDESFFMYLEDVDYCLRAKNAGIKIFHTKESIITHIGGASSNNKDRIRHSSWLKSRKIYYAKHFGVFENIIIQPIFLLDDMLILMNMTIKSIFHQPKPTESNL